METLIMTVHYLLCFFLIVIILLQAGKGADMGAIFGGASQTVFGSRGPTTFLNKMTAAVAILFLVTSILLAHISNKKSANTIFDKASVTDTSGNVPAADRPLIDFEKKDKEAPADNKTGGK
jgi:preprotein translocase subunit SecG